MNYPRRFIFRGNASGISAHIRRPNDRILTVQAASSLPVIGGVSDSKAPGQSLDDYLSFEFAETSARGDFKNAKAAIAITNHKKQPDEVPTQTSVMARVGGLKIGDKFSATLAQVGLSSQSPRNAGDQVPFRLDGNKLEGITVAGRPLNITLEERFFNRCETLQGLEAAYRDGLSAEQTAMFHAPAKGGGKKLQISEGLAYATLVRKMEWPEGKPEDLEELGPNAFYLDDFGSVFFGEMLISSAYRRITMIRFQFGSPYGGEASVAEGETNGSFWP